MLSNWPIRFKLIVGGALLLVIVATLSAAGLRSVYAYRDLVKRLSPRATELPLATELIRHVSDLRVTLSQTRGTRQGFPLDAADLSPAEDPLEGPILREQFRIQFITVQTTVERYRQTLNANERNEVPLGDGSRERQTLSKIDATLQQIDQVNRDEDWMLNTIKADELNEQLEYLQTLTAELPSYLHRRIQQLPSRARGEYRTLLLLTWASAIGAGLMLVLFVRLAYGWLIGPLQVLIQGSRRVAEGDFDHRIELATNDEMSGLADAMNDMTARFQAVRDDLGSQVRERTDQVARSEQLASLGVLAAGVAHEINNPLASIAMCAESLEGRVRDLLTDADEEHQIVGNYLQMIQTEAFRCKEITDRMLDFSRSGDVPYESTELRVLVQGVIDVVRHLEKYQGKQIELVAGDPIVAEISPQEIKQVVLNLVTNSLDSLEPGGKATVEIHTERGLAELIFTDNGCGMTDEVLQHLFEPFFTRRRSGQGTGLGLSIAHRIIQEHQGQIGAKSDGPDRGSQFLVTLPLRSQSKENQHRHQAA